MNPFRLVETLRASRWGVLLDLVFYTVLLVLIAASLGNKNIGSNESAINFEYRVF